MRVGCADIVITPPVGISLAGFSARHEGARGIHDDLHARALVFDDGGRRAALVVCDLCELDRPAIDALRWHIERATGIQPGSVMIAATHTHAAPATFPLYSAPPDPSWLEQLPQRVARAADAA
ncbi:MAG: neutral/alkaline non-lysosomal ceramidase N-terminal domain-containing protein, partial [Armatimonadota bacterium]